MKQTITLFPLLLLFLLPAAPALAGFSGGDGSRAHPWEIATAAELNEVRNHLGDHFILTADIDLTSETGDASGALWDNGAGWEPIGTFGSPFIGSLDGNGFTITGLTIDRSRENEVGLFRWTGFGAVLTGLALEAVDISGDSLVGALVVTNFGGTVTNSYVTGRVRGEVFVGGLVGRNLSGKVTNSYATAQVDGTAKVGGLVGSSWAAITNSYATGRVSGDANVGGLVGINPVRTVKNSYWNTETSGQRNSSGGGTGLTSARMRQQASFVGFDFDNAWQFPETGAFPVLATNPQDPSRVDNAGFDPHTISPDRVNNNRVLNDGRVTDILENSDSGELILYSSDVRIIAQSYGVRQASPEQEEGIFINADGDLVWITPDRQQVSGYPLVADRTLFSSLLEDLDLQLEYGEFASMRLSRAGDVPGNEGYLSVRADLVAIPAPFEKNEGLYSRTVLRNVQVAYLVFMDENGTLMQQDLVPVPADWPALKAMLAGTPGVSDVRMDPEGIITLSMNGLTVQARMDYGVSRGAVQGEETAQGVALFSAGDVNGDRVSDFQVRYPNGDVQLLLIIP